MNHPAQCIALLLRKLSKSVTVRQGYILWSIRQDCGFSTASAFLKAGRETARRLGAASSEGTPTTTPQMRSNVAQACSGSASKRQGRCFHAIRHGGRRAKAFVQARATIFPFSSDAILVGCMYDLSVSYPECMFDICVSCVFLRTLFPVNVG